MLTTRASAASVNFFIGLSLLGTRRHATMGDSLLGLSDGSGSDALRFQGAGRHSSVGRFLVPFTPPVSTSSSTPKDFLPVWETMARPLRNRAAVPSLQQGFPRASMKLESDKAAQQEGDGGSHGVN